MTNFLSSFSISNTAALVGLLSIFIPLVIHIINRSRGKLVYLGNIEFVKKVKRIRVTEMKLTQWLLLIIRVLIFVLLSLLVAGLSQLKDKTVSNETQLVFSANWISTQEKLNFNSIQNKHPKAKAFALVKGYPELNNENFEAIKQHIKLTKDQIHSSAWMAEIANRHQQAKQTKMFITNSSDELSTLRPQLVEGFEWNILAVIDEVNLLEEIEVTIFYDESRILDSRILNIVFEHIKAVGNDRFKVTFKSTSKASESSQLKGWIIWLSDLPVAEEIIENVKLGSFLLTDYTAKKDQQQTQLQKIITNATIAGIKSEFIGFQRSLGLVDLSHNVVWSDNLNAELLSFQTLGSGLHYSFSSRFNPAWNNLVENPKFPIIFSELLSRSAIRLQPKQIAQSEIKSLPKISRELQLSKNLDGWLIFIISLLWLIERWLAERRKGV